jgi:GNAT superfamily N-acetyltransferase
VEVRRRTESDLDACVALAAVVKAVDDYPPHLPHELLRFVVGSDSIDAWVAQEEGNVVGHVALNRTTSDEVMALAGQVLGKPPEALAVVARLFVAPTRRGEGTGARLLRTATVAAVDRGLAPILDVATHFKPAIALYEKLGWRRVGSVTVTFLEQDLHEFVYVGPGQVPTGRWVLGR